MLALVWIRPLSCSDDPEPSSEAVIDWLSAVTVPAATDGVPPAPPALPSPTTLSPTFTVEELPVVAVVSPDAPDSCSTATSWLCVVTDHGRLVGLAVADVGDAHRRGAVDHVVVRQNLAVGGQDDAGAHGRGALVAKGRGHVDQAGVDPAGDLRCGQHRLRRRRGVPGRRAAALGQPDARASADGQRHHSSRGQPERVPATRPPRRLRHRVRTERVLCEWLTHGS